MSDEKCSQSAVVEAETVRANRTTDVYVLMVRYGPDFWAAHMTHRDLETATKQAAGVSTECGQDEWRIVCVRGLPVGVASGEV